jgi:TonB-dependent SusC/RagA subfamily outer membrane receptor
VSSIDKIEVLKSASNLAIFGSRGANGVIAVYTKHGENVGTDEYYKGIISEKLRGYYLAREFYSPDYDSVTGGKPDHRTTIYWNPEVKTDSAGVAKFSFFTTDDPGFMMLKVEGLSYDGKPGVGFLTIPKTNNLSEFKTQTSQKD